MMSSRTLVWCLFMLVVGLTARNLGLRVRITQKGLTYANSVAIQALQTSIRQIKIPDQSGKASGFHYDIYNIRVTQFSPPSSTITIRTGSGLQWKADNGFIEIEGSFKYKKWGIKGHGTFTAKVSGVNFNVALNIGSDVAGKLHISAGPCSASVGKVDFEFHGGASWLYNLFRGKVGRLIKDKLNSVLRPEIIKAVNVDAEKKMQELPMTSTLAKKFLLDYTLTSVPIFNPGYMETYHKGEVYWKAKSKSEAPFEPTTMPNTSDTQSMLYLWLSDYVLDTFMYQAQMHGYLVRNVTNKDVGKKYPNSSVELRMNSTSVPKLKVSGSGIMASFAGNIDLYAKVPGKVDTPFLITLMAMMTEDLNISVSSQMIYASINDITLNLKAGKSNIGPVDDTFLNFLVNQALKGFIIPKLNELGAHGFPLPMTKDITFINTSLVLSQDLLQISTDIRYTPTDTIEIYDVTENVVIDAAREVDMDTDKQHSLGFLKNILKDNKLQSSY